jgi:hypothetical protein
LSLEEWNGTKFIETLVYNVKTQQLILFRPGMRYDGTSAQTLPVTLSAPLELQWTVPSRGAGLGTRITVTIIEDEWREVTESVLEDGSTNFLWKVTLRRVGGATLSF